MDDYAGQLNNAPGSSTPRQRQRLVIAAKRRGLALDDLRSSVGGSLRQLSAADASVWIQRLTGRSLPNPPGKKPPVYPRGKDAGVVRMITDDLIDQIARLSIEYLGSRKAAEGWLLKNFNVRDPRQLGTAELAGQVIWVLKEMNDRRESKTATA